MDEFEDLSKTIKNIQISVRSYNCLRRNNIYTLDQLIALTQDELIKFRNMGKKSVDEIITIQNNYRNNYNNTENTKVKHKIFCNVEQSSTFSFYNRRGDLVQELHIDDLELSVRATNCLLDANIEFTSQLIDIEYNELLSIKNMGKKTFDEIISTLQKKSVAIYDFKIDSNKNKVLEDYLTTLNKDIKSFLDNIISQEIINELRKFVNKNIELFDLNNDLLYGDIIDEFFFNSNYIKNIIKTSCILKLFQKNKFISRQFIETNLPIKFKNKKLLDVLLQELTLEKSIECVDGEFRKYLPNIIDFIECQTNMVYKEVISLRLSGQTLEEIGTKLKVTRERIRQIFKKVTERRPLLSEDYYKDCFEKYDILKSDFMKLYEIDEFSYNYLNLFYNKGVDPFINILDNENISRNIRNKAEELLSKNFLFVNNNIINKTRYNFLMYVLKEYCCDEVVVEDFKWIYTEFLKENSLENEIFQFTDRYFESTLANNKNILWKYKKKLRYYDIESYDINDFINNLHLINYKNIEISALKLFKDNFDLMIQYDIRDEYELHNLLKKNFTNTDELIIDFSRMPLIQFGNVNRDMQVLDMLLLTSPISNYDFAKEYENEYGVKSKTVLANFLKCIDEYLYNGMFSIEYNNLSEHEYFYMNKMLTNDFYTISDIKKIYLEEYPNGDISLVNSFNIKLLGYKVFSNYAISNKYTSVDNYIRKCLTQKDLTNINDFKSITLIQQYYIILQELRSDLVIIEYEPFNYINIRKLEEKGVFKSHLRAYINSALKIVEDNYFTIKYLNNIGFSHELDELGLDDYFYASLVRTNPKIKYIKTNGTFIFKSDVESIRILDFLIYLIGKLRSIDIYDFIDYLKDTYGVLYNKNKVLTLISNSSLYYILPEV